MNEAAAQIILASGSPRRAELLEQLKIRFMRVLPDVDESARPGEDVVALVERLARAKALAGSAMAGTALPVLGADTLVAVDGVALGKPAGRSEALDMLARLSGRAHEVVSAVAVVAGGSIQAAVSRSTVTFRTISEAEAVRYWDTGEPRDKAGAYAIQGVGSVFVEHLKGSYSGVVGLPLLQTERLLAAAGVDCWRHRQA
ncbi:MAG: septum formation inhibitor Maf [Gammaproteobacteria bacterium]|nr:septum formation inhibitor Maf [Gammaproteobacteria bacterium]